MFNSIQYYNFLFRLRLKLREPVHNIFRLFNQDVAVGMAMSLLCIHFRMYKKTNLFYRNRMTGEDSFGLLHHEAIRIK